MPLTRFTGSVGSLFFEVCKGNILSILLILSDISLRLCLRFRARRGANFDRINRIFRIVFSQFPDETEKGVIQ
jgi:hypothetical protein